MRHWNMGLAVAPARAAWIGLGLLVAVCARADAPEPWRLLAPGLELGTFSAPDSSAADSSIVVVRIDPERFNFRLHCISETNETANLTARQWAAKTGAVAVINAGMFDTDYRTHVGYLRAGAHVNSDRDVASYRSAFVFGARRSADRGAAMFDLDTVPLDSLLLRYDHVVQNLRLISKPGVNRWSQQPRKWSEAALAEDASGRVLFIFVRPPLTMHDLNHHLLALPLGITCAQHLEGGPEAQLFVSAGGHTFEWVGGAETGFISGNMAAWPIPNVLAVFSGAVDRPQE